jgi:hypothetical protein
MRAGAIDVLGTAKTKEEEALVVLAELCQTLRQP